MNFQNSKYTLRFADATDNEGIREIFESESFHGDIDVKILRSAHPYESFQADGEEAKILVIIENETHKRVAVGGAVVRREYLNGREEKCAYLTGLKVHPEYRKKIFLIAKAYELLRESIHDCTFSYTTILDSNEMAIKLFEKKHKNLPEYRYLGHYITYCFHGGNRKLTLEKDNLHGFNKLMQEYFSKQNLTPCDYNYKGFGEKTFYCVRENNEIIACCYVGNQQMYKQYKMCSYGGIYNILSHVPTQFFGYPKFPKKNSMINYGIVSYLYVKDNDKKLCSDFLRSVAVESDYELLLWGGFENNPLSKALDSMKTVRYGSRLYQVVWNKRIEVSGIIGMEAALL